MAFYRNSRSIENFISRKKKSISLFFFHSSPRARARINLRVCTLCALFQRPSIPCARAIEQLDRRLARLKGSSHQARCGPGCGRQGGLRCAANGQNESITYDFNETGHTKRSHWNRTWSIHFGHLRRTQTALPTAPRTAPRLVWQAL